MRHSREGGNLLILPLLVHRMSLPRGADPAQINSSITDLFLLLTSNTLQNNEFKER